jgi:hypothetical protein
MTAHAAGDAITQRTRVTAPTRAAPRTRAPARLSATPPPSALSPGTREAARPDVQLGTAPASQMPLARATPSSRNTSALPASM